MHYSLRPRGFVSAAVVAALLTTNAQAAVLANIDGLVSVNYGNGFLPASIGSTLAPGDRVRTEKGTVDILYDNGCSTRVGPQQVALVQSAPPPCSGGLKDGPVGPIAEEPLVSPLVLGGVAVAGAVGLVLALSSNNNNTPILRPVSP